MLLSSNLSNLHPLTSILMLNEFAALATSRRSQRDWIAASNRGGEIGRRRTRTPTAW